MYLSLDTGTEVLGISILDNGKKPLYRLSLTKFKPFSEIIVDKLDSIFNELGLEKNNIEAVIVNVGPGSYTGLRIGVSTAKTIAYILKRDIYIYDSLSTLAYKYRYVDGDILVVLNAGKGEVYLQEFNVNLNEIKPISEIKLKKLKSLDNDFLQKFKLVITKNLQLEGNNIIKDVEDLSLYGAFYSLEKNLKFDILKVEPIYIRGL
jgi:tRNA threonylcarbamoyladenosine biosynthesis protein TsaB